MQSLRDLSLDGSKVVLRVDFNVPLDSDFNITDDTRIRLTIPTIEYLLGRGCQIFLLAHFGRPQKKRLSDGSIDVNRFTLRHVVKRLEELTDTEVDFVTLEGAIGAASDRKLVLIENTRFHPGEEKGDSELAKKFAGLGDFYINDAFGAAHRRHASTATIAEYFASSHKGAGFLLEKEIKEAQKLLTSDKTPFTAIVGGAKVSDKIGVLSKLIEVCDKVLIGGAMAYTFLKAQGGEIGNSLVEEDKLGLALDILAKAQKNNTILLLPVDSIVADAFAADAETRTCPSSEIERGWMGLDIGPEAIREYSKAIQESGKIFWNGPMGVFEMEAFAKGTFSVAQAVADSTKEGAYSLIGGGDSVAAIYASGLAEEVSFISSGGGAMLEFLEGKTLPGVDALESGS